ncbi:DNA polymerase III subunit alpha, partial [Pseudoxanthobacter sp.]|uniref:DNA polymerase III subunit alpha n=1 Tax=Pseudoxanthobacter sp. TaxID=1925742 RepID=UPI002FDFB983
MTGSSPGFVHLRVHTAYSLLEGAMHVKKVLGLAKDDRQPAVAMTDSGNLFGALEFSAKAMESGIQPIIGSELWVDFADEDTGRRGMAREPFHTIVLFASTPDGFANLVRLVSRAFLETETGVRPHVGLDTLAALSEGLIALSGGPRGPVDRALQAGNGALAEARLKRLAALFPDRLYVELQRHGLAGEQAVEPHLVELAYRHELPLVATNEVYFGARDDYEAHDALLAIAEGRTLIEDDRRRLTPEHYFKTRAEMRSLFADLPEAVENTVEIARRCAAVAVKRKPILPRFAGVGADPEQAMREEAALLRRRAEEGLALRLKTRGYAEGATDADYAERLEFELGIIERMKFPGYFLIVSDFIQWAKAHGIPVGPGRGSGAGSLVAYSLTITDLDPMRFGLLFERFLNPERVSMPDFDIDFCQDRREEVIRYVQEKYGRAQVAQIITFGSLQARAV